MGWLFVGLEDVITDGGRGRWRRRWVRCWKMEEMLKNSITKCLVLRAKK